MGMNGPHGGHHGGHHPSVAPWRPWWRGWGDNWLSSPVVYQVPQAVDNTPLYFLGGALLLGALILSRR